jgi:hypothetical protein
LTARIQISGGGGLLEALAGLAIILGDAIAFFKGDIGGPVADEAPPWLCAANAPGRLKKEFATDLSGLQNNIIYSSY